MAATARRGRRRRQMRRLQITLAIVTDASRQQIRSVFGQSAAERARGREDDRTPGKPIGRSADKQRRHCIKITDCRPTDRRPVNGRSKSSSPPSISNSILRRFLNSVYKDSFAPQ